MQQSGLFQTIIDGQTIAKQREGTCCDLLISFLCCFSPHLCYPLFCL